MWEGIIVTLSLLVAGIICGQTDTGNLIYNPSFEEGDVVPMGWRIIDEQGARHAAEIDYSRRRFGRASWKVTRTNEPVGWYCLYPTFLDEKALLKEGEVYTCTWWYYFIGSGEARLILQIAYDDWKKSIGSPTEPLIKGEWQRMSFTFTVPSGVKKLDCIRFAITHTDQGDTVWVDGFRLNRGAKATAFISPVETETWLSCKRPVGEAEVRPVLHAISPVETPGVVTISLRDLKGRVIPRPKQSVNLVRGINEFSLHVPLADIPDDVYCVQASLLDTKGKALDQPITIKIEKISTTPIRKKMDVIKERLAELKNLVEQAKTKGLDTSYQDLAIILAEDFLVHTETDLQTGFLADARHIVNYLLESLKRAETELRQMFKQPSKQKIVPRPSMMASQLRVERGAFYSGNQPVLLFGLCAFEQGRRDIPKLQMYGFNTTEITTMYIKRLFRTSDSLDPETLKSLHDWLDRCEKYNLAAAFLFDLEWLPRWFVERYPDVRFPGDTIEQAAGVDGGGPWPRFIIDHPEVGKFLEHCWRTLLPILSRKPALHSYILANEPQFERSADNPFALKRFHLWLKDKYGNVQNLNARWNKNYKNFEEVTFNDCMDPRRNKAARYDWALFNWSRGTNLFSTFKKIIREYDKKAPIHIKIMNWPAIFGAERVVRAGINREDVAAEGELDATGCDGWFFYLSKGNYIESNYGFWGQIICYEFLKSIAPDRPIIDSEWHFLRLFKGVETPEIYLPSPQYVRAAIWESCIHGVGGIYFWLWDRIRAIPDNGHLSDGGITVDPVIVETIGRTCLDLRRLAEYVIEFPRQKAEVRILYSYPSIIQQGQKYLDEVFMAYKASFFQGLPVRFITEKQIGKREWSGCKLIIVPGAEYVTDECFAGVCEFVKSGGTVVLIGEPFKFNEYGDRREKSLEVSPRVHRIAKSPPSLIEYNDLVSKWITAAGIDRPLKITDVRTGKEAFGIKARLAKVNEENILYLINWNPTAIEVTINLYGKKPKFIDLVDGNRIGHTIKIEPLGLYLLKQVK